MMCVTVYLDQVNACLVETERLGALLSSSGPAVAVSPSLSTLFAVDVRLANSDVIGGGAVGLPSNRLLVNERLTARDLQSSSSTLRRRYNSSLCSSDASVRTCVTLFLAAVYSASLDIRWYS